MAKDPGPPTARADVAGHVDQDLLHRKEAELAKVVDEHDDLVREQYHLDTFITMISGFDPAMVKHERGQDFQRYAQQYDLFAKYGDMLGPGRASRRRIATAQAAPDYNATKKVELPKLAASSAVQGKKGDDAGGAESSRRGAAGRKGEDEEAQVTGSKRGRTVAGDGGDEEGSRGEKRGPGRPRRSEVKVEQAEEVEEEEEVAPIPVKRGPGRPPKVKVAVQPAEVEVVRSHKGKGRAKQEPVEVAQPRGKGRGHSLRAVEVIEEPPKRGPGRPKKVQPVEEPISVMAKGKGKGIARMQQEPEEAVNVNMDEEGEEDELVLPPTKTNGRGSKRKAPTPAHHAQSRSKRRQILDKRSPSRSPSPEPIFPPPYTCPEQRPTFEGKHYNSVQEYLESYKMLEEKDLDARALINEARTEARLRERIRFLQMQGRLLRRDDEEDLEEDVGDGQGEQSQAQQEAKFSARAVLAATKPGIEARRAPGHRDFLLAHALQVGAAMAWERKNHIALAKRMSKAIQTYWDREKHKGDREKRDEEKQRKAMLREISKAVRAKWQLAVNVVRVKKQAEHKAEQERLGKAHLESILERSRDLLGNQMSETPEAEEGEHEEDGGETDEDMSRASSEEEQTLAEEASEDEGERENSDEESEVDDMENPYDMLYRGTSSPAPATVDTANGTTPHILGTPNHAAVGIAQSDSAQTLVQSSEDSATPPRRLRRRVQQKSIQIDVKTEDPDANDVEFQDAEDHADEDAEMDMEMEAEEEMGEKSEMEEGDDEDEGLLADADLPIDELLKRYGYDASDIKKPQPKVNGSALHLDGERVGTAELSDPVHQESYPESDVDMGIGAGENESADSDADTESASESGGSESDEDVSEAPGIAPPFLLRAQMRPYQLTGLEWLAQLYKDGRNAILADEMGLGKTLQTIALLAHLACDYGQWGPHLIIVPTSVLLNWEMEFKKFLPGFKVLTYYGTQQERKELRKGWSAPHAFEVLITSYQIVLADEFIFRRRSWQYMILDEAHNIKNFRSQRWQALLGFKSERRLLLTGTPLQNNLMELWSLLYFLMPQGLSHDLSLSGGFANHKEFNEWFSNPMEKAIELGGQLTPEAQATVDRLHIILRPFILRRLKAEVETQLPGKFEHVVYCDLSKRQRFLYDEFMARGSTRNSLMNGGYLGIANCLMQLRKVCNHPDLFEVRPVRTSFAMETSVARTSSPVFDRLSRLLPLKSSTDSVGDLPLQLDLLASEGEPKIASSERSRLDASHLLPFPNLPDNTPPCDTRTIDGWKRYRAYRQLQAEREKWTHLRQLNSARVSRHVRIGAAFADQLKRQVACGSPILNRNCLSQSTSGWVKDIAGRIEELKLIVDRFAAATPAVVAPDLADTYLPPSLSTMPKPGIDALHNTAVRLQISFPDNSLLQHDCGKLQILQGMLKRLKEEGHRVLIFTQMTRMLDVLEIFLSFNGHRYLRLDGSTKVEDRLIVTERFNTTNKIFALIASTRSGGVGINLTGADTVIFYDNEFNPAMDKQAMDRAHRIGQTREVHIYRMVTRHTVEENMLKKANQKRRLDDLVMQEGNFTTDINVKMDLRDVLGEDVITGLQQNSRQSSGTPAPTDSGGDETRMEEAFAQAEDEEDAEAAKHVFDFTAMDAPDFEAEAVDEGLAQNAEQSGRPGTSDLAVDNAASVAEVPVDEQEEASDMEEDEAGAIDEYMLAYVNHEWDTFFSGWKRARGK